MIILVWQMLYLSKEMKKSVKQEIVLLHPILMHGGGGALLTSPIGSRHTLILAISSRLWGSPSQKIVFFVASSMRD